MTTTLGSPSAPARARRRRSSPKAPEVRRATPRSGASAAVVDVLSVACASAALQFGAPGTGARSGPVLWLIAFGVATILLLHVRGLYRFRLRSSLVDDMSATLACTLLAAAAVLTARSITAPDLHAASQTAVVWAFVAPNLMVVRTARSLANRWAFRRGGTSNTLIIGAGAVGRQVAQRLHDRPEIGLRPIGFLDKDPLPVPARADDPPVLGASWDLEEQVALQQVSTVLFTFSTAPHHVYLDLIRRSHRLGLRVLLVPRLFEQMSGRVELAHLGGMGVLHVDPVPHRSWRFSTKYLLDRVLATAAFVAVSPVLAILALAVRLTSPGPILFRQPRVGLDGREFDMLKFRTMTGSPEVDGEADAAWAARSSSGQLESHHLDSGLPGGAPVDRTTPLGRLLRKLSLDELPQLLNVVRGEMSLVGPRPERVEVAHAFEQSIPRYRERHRVKPGMTGWAQVQGLRGNTSLADRVEWDNHYVENWTPWFDMKIILLTASAVISARHAS